ncbi:MAG: hypothetical protein GY865_03680 [candidate division Zixibacteria bacterium]|nr:hypothetical protein [candidate division Zixibacteria bacterium]
MNKFKAIFIDSFWEIRAGKMLYIYSAVALFTAFLAAIIPSIEIGGQDILNSEMIGKGVIGGMSGMFFEQLIGFMIFLIYLGTAWLIPAFLKKGRIELSLSKPISRVNFLTMKFTALYLISILILTAVSVTIWLVLSFRLDNFDNGIFSSLLAGYVEFFIIFSIIFAFGVIIRSGAFALMSYFLIKIVSGLLASREMVYNFVEEGILTYILDTLYHILPKFQDMSESLMMFIANDHQINYYPIWSTLLFAIFLIGITSLVFQKRDY